MARSQELRDLGDGDLVERLAETKDELFNLRFQVVTGQLDNSARIKQVKKEIARILTELRAREIFAAEASASAANAGNPDAGNTMQGTRSERHA